MYRNVYPQSWLDCVKLYLRRTSHRQPLVTPLSPFNILGSPFLFAHPTSGPLLIFYPNRATQYIGALSSSNTNPSLPLEYLQTCNGLTSHLAGGDGQVSLPYRSLTCQYLWQFPLQTYYPIVGIGPGHPTHYNLGYQGFSPEEISSLHTQSLSPHILVPSPYVPDSSNRFFDLRNSIRNGQSLSLISTYSKPHTGWRWDLNPVSGVYTCEFDQAFDNTIPELTP